MKCDNCGKIIPENLIYCPYCSCKIKNNKEECEKLSEQNKRAEDSVILYKENDALKKQKKHTGAILICFSLFIIFLIISFLLFLSAKGKIGRKETEKNKPEFTTVGIKENIIIASEALSEDNEMENNTDYYTYPAE